MWRVVRSHLVAKIAIVLVATLCVGFGLPALLGARVQSELMARRSEASASAISKSLAAGVRTAMLSGNGITARRMVEDARGRLGEAQLKIYAPSGEEVFGPKPPVPDPASLPEHIGAALRTAKTQPAPDAARALPIPNEARCQKCHDDGPLRAVLTIGTRGGTVQLTGGRETHEVVSPIVESAFVQIMTGEKEDGLDTFFAELAEKTPGLVGVAVLDAEGDVAFGSTELGISEAVAKRVLIAGQARGHRAAAGSVHIRPLVIEPQCLACHEATPKIRGAIVTVIDPDHAAWTETVVHATDVSLRHVMLAGLGRLIARFLDSVPATGAVTALTLHDAQGRLYRDAFDLPDPPAMVEQALAAGESRHAVLAGEGGEETFTFVEPLTNDPECQQCHGTDYDLRGAIEVVLDTSEAARSRTELVRTGAIFGLGTILLSMLVLYVGLRWLVLRPVSEMGDVADQVGAGKLDASVDVRTMDEIGRLGSRLNEMILEMRRKIELAKFVSAATVQSVDAAESGVKRAGQRQRMAVLFSDIRGFTSFSETVDPEAVVEMLNHYLDAQAAVVGRHGGDIDKFVGDELMAHFHGQDMEARAIRCAVEMLEAVGEIGRQEGPDRPPMQVGIGINVGEVIFGAMGASSRMDFTVIGDTVNLGARLCDAAGGGEVLITHAMREAIGDAPDLQFTPREPIAVKGKRDPIRIYSVTRRRGAAADP
jgi:adenylate cyclase